MPMKRVGERPLLSLASTAKSNDRGIREDSVTNQLRVLAKQKHRKRRPFALQPLDICSQDSVATQNNALLRDDISVQKQIQGPVTLQWLVDDFVQAAGEGNIHKVDHYIRGGIPIDMKHSVLQQTALHASAALKSDVVTRYLVQAGATVDSLTKDHESTLHLAARYHSVSVAEEVLRNSADTRVFNKNELLAMEVAAEIQDHAMKQLLEPPPASPSNVRASRVWATSLMIEWSSHGRATSAYQFRVAWVLSGSLGESFAICSGSCFRVCNLMPSTQYEVRVQTGYLSGGWGASSDMLMVETDGGVPNAMAAPSILRVSDRSVAMRIRLPPSNGADIQRVSIQLQCMGSMAAVSTSSFRRLLKSADQDQRWETIACEVALMRNCEENANDKEHSVEGLLPGHVYYFRVKASNRYGWSSDGEVSDGICTNDHPKVVATTPRSMTLVWTKPHSTELIDKYRVLARASYSTKWETIADEIVGQRADVHGLIPATAYSFRVVQHYALSRGWEDAENCTCTELYSTLSTVPEPPVGLRVVDRTARSITLSWEMPRCNGLSLEVYKVEYRIRGLPNREWIAAATDVRVDVSCFCVDALLCGQPYQFRVCARNALGEGGSVALEDPPVWTSAFLPPTAAICLAKTSFSLTIEWYDGPSVDDGSTVQLDTRELQYDVEMCHVDSSLLHAPDHSERISSSGVWRTVADGLKRRQALISGLVPLGCYCFRVRARSVSSSTLTPAEEDAGSVFSPLSAVFQTLRRM